PGGLQHAPDREDDDGAGVHHRPGARGRVGAAAAAPRGREGEAVNLPDGSPTPVGHPWRVSWFTSGSPAPPGARFSRSLPPEPTYTHVVAGRRRWGGWWR